MTTENAGAFSRPILITFSGIDGAGKTTQISRLTTSLEERGLRVLRLSFWEHVAVWSRLRAGVGHHSIGQSISHNKLTISPKNNKHIRKWYLTLARSGFYFLDSGRLRALLSQAAVRKNDVVIFDRYIYDQIANVYSTSAAVRSYSKLLLRYAPTPTLAFIIDVAPSDAFVRKPEYPLDFMHRNRRNFLQLREIQPQMIVIPSSTEAEVANTILAHVLGSTQLRRDSYKENAHPASAAAVLQSQTFRRVQERPTVEI